MSDDLSVLNVARPRTNLDRYNEKLTKLGGKPVDALSSAKSTKPPPAIERYRRFPVETFPEPARSFISEWGTAIGCDPSFVGLPTFACLARAIGNTRVIQPKETWQEYPIIWAAIIGKSGTHKSPAMKASTTTLQRLQALAFEEHKDAVARYTDDLVAYERDIATWKREKGTTEPPPQKPPEPVCRRYIVSDATMEAMVVLLDVQNDGVLLVRDELAGWVDGIAEYKGGKGSDNGHWLACWSGEAMTVDRKGGTKNTYHIPRASVSVVGGIQPGILSRTMGREHLQDGMCARLLMAMPEDRPIRWTEATIAPATAEAMETLYARLLELEPASTVDGLPIPVALKFTPEAKKVWVDYYNRHRGEMESLDDDLRSAWSKLEAYTARFALIFQLVGWATNDADGGAVDEASLRAAITLSDWFGGEAKRVYGTFSESDEDREVRRLVELIERKGGRITANELRKSSSIIATNEEADGLLTGLAKVGRGRWEHAAASDKGGRPTRVFVLTGGPTETETSTISEENAGLGYGNSVVHSESEGQKWKF